MFSASLAVAQSDFTPCAAVPKSELASGPLTIKEIEGQEMAKLPDTLKWQPDMPKLPFGFGHAEWVAFKSRARPGDKIYRYVSSQHSWEHHAGRAGLVLVRAGCVVGEFTTMMN
jgi:hypothetical protein